MGYLINQIEGYEIPGDAAKNSSNGRSGSPKTPEVSADSAFIEAAMSPSGTLWRRWFDRVGDAANVHNVNATAELVIGERDIATATLKAAAKAALKYVDNLNEDAPTYPACPDCTSGTVPNKWNEGPCWIHQLERAIRGTGTSPWEAERDELIDRLARTSADLRERNEEVQRLKNHIRDLNADLEGTIADCNKHHGEAA